MAILLHELMPVDSEGGDLGYSAFEPNTPEWFAAGGPLVPDYYPASGGTLNDFGQPTYPAQTDATKGVTLQDVHDANTIQPSAPETFVVPFEQVVDFVPYQRDIPRDNRNGIGMLNVNAPVVPLTTVEQNNTNKSMSTLDANEIPNGYVWNITGLSWSGVVVFVVMIAAVWYAFKKGG